MISCGVALASRGELRFDLGGFFIQAGAVLFEASHLVPSKSSCTSSKWTPSYPYTTTHSSALINLCILPFTEGLEPFRHLLALGPLVLFMNAGVAFLLNVAAVFLIGVGGGLVLPLAGVFKRGW